MVLKRSKAHATPTVEGATEKEAKDESKTKLLETTKPSNNEGESPAEPLPELEPTPSPAAKLSKRAAKRMRGWEPVIKPPEDITSIPSPSAVPTADVVWLDKSRSVTLIPNNGSGVQTRRGAANLAAASPPTSYLVYTRDPLCKKTKAGSQSVHVLMDLPPGGDARTMLSNVPSVSSLTQRSGETASEDSDTASSTVSSSSCSPRLKGEVKEDGESECERELEIDRKVEEGIDDADSVSQRAESQSMAEISAKSTVKRKSEPDAANKGKKNAAQKKADDAAPTSSSRRGGGLSAAQAMLPPPYRRNRRLKRKLLITEETPVFTAHNELRDTMPELFPKAPFSTEEDVLRSTVDWRDDPVLVYTRLLWEFAPDEFLKRAMR